VPPNPARASKSSPESRNLRARNGASSTPSHVPANQLPSAPPQPPPPRWPTSGPAHNVGRPPPPPAPGRVGGTSGERRGGRRGPWRKRTGWNPGSATGRNGGGGGRAAGGRCLVKGPKAPNGAARGWPKDTRAGGPGGEFHGQRESLSMTVAPPYGAAWPSPSGSTYDGGGVAWAARLDDMRKEARWVRTSMTRSKSVARTHALPDQPLESTALNRPSSRGYRDSCI